MRIREGPLRALVVGLTALAAAYVVGFALPGLQNIFALTAVFAVAVWLGGDSVVRRFGLSWCLPWSSAWSSVW